MIKAAAHAPDATIKRLRSKKARRSATANPAIADGNEAVEWKIAGMVIAASTA